MQKKKKTLKKNYLADNPLMGTSVSISWEPFVVP